MQMSEFELSHGVQVLWPSFSFGVMMIAQALYKHFNQSETTTKYLNNNKLQA